MDELTKSLVEAAGQFDVHRWSDYPEVGRITRTLFEEITALRKLNNPKARVRDPAKIQRAIRVIVLDLFIAATVLTNPYRSISKNRNDYVKGTRYRKLFLKYGILIPAIDDLTSLGYVEQVAGKFGGNYTRIRATFKLVDLIKSEADDLIEQKGIATLADRSQEGEESIVLKNGDKELIDYPDTPQTVDMHQRLEVINELLQQTQIALDIDDYQYNALVNLLNDKSRVPDFTKKSLYRVFNNGSFEQGGRFYGGWWERLPRSFRKYITIDGCKTIELDYSGHHIRMLYAEEGLSPPDDPYALPGFNRRDVKNAVLIVLNAANEESAIKAMSSKGIKSSRDLLAALKKMHEPIADTFHKGLGVRLQYQDSLIAEDVMFHLAESNIVVLPVHDSFVVADYNLDYLVEAMEWSFEDRFLNTAKIKMKEAPPSTYKRGKYEDYKGLGYYRPTRQRSYDWYQLVWGNSNR